MVDQPSREAKSLEKEMGDTKCTMEMQKLRLPWNTGMKDIVR